MKIYKYFIMLAMGLTTPLLTSCDTILGEDDNPVTIEISKISIKADGLSKGEVTVTVGTRLQLTAEIFPDNATDVEIIWSSSNDKIVSVSSRGLVKAEKPGDAVVKVVSKANRAVGASIKVHVVDHIQALKITGEGITNGETTVTVGSNIQLSAELTPANTLEKEIEWQSDNETSATVSDKGLVNTLKIGDAKIKVVSKVDSKVSDAVTVHVVDHIQSLAISGPGVVNGKVALKLGATLQLDAELTPSNTLETGIAWSSANADVATVSSAGVITAAKVGEAKIKLASTVNTKVFTELVVTGVDDLIDTGSGTVDPGAAESRRM